MAGGGQPGNTNAKRGTLVRDEIRRQLKAASSDDDLNKLRKIVESLIAKAIDGDIVATKEIFDRMDGKPTAVIGNEDSDRPFIVEIRN